jgi:hypothetical protein
MLNKEIKAAKIAVAKPAADAGAKKESAANKDDGTARPSLSSKNPQDLAGALALLQDQKAAFTLGALRFLTLGYEAEYFWWDFVTIFA